MAGNHGARQQKRVAKQKAKRAAKRSRSLQLNSSDPNVRLRQADKWPVVRAVVGEEIWDDGISSVAIARRESEGNLVYSVFLVDVFCLGVKNAYWDTGTPRDFDDVIQRMAERQTLREIAPACLVKIVKDAVAYAHSFGFQPHPDYRHAALLLAGIDPAACTEQFAFGREGKPFYIRGPHETPAQATAIVKRVVEAGGHFIVGGPGAELTDVIPTGSRLEHDDDEDDDEHS